MTLQNIRYELQWRGNKLWKIEDDRETQVGIVAPVVGLTRWAGSCAGYPVESFPDELTARHCVEAAVRAKLPSDSVVDIT